MLFFRPTTKRRTQEEAEIRQIYFEHLISRLLLSILTSFVFFSVFEMPNLDTMIPKSCKYEISILHRSEITLLVWCLFNSLDSGRPNDPARHNKSPLPNRIICEDIKITKKKLFRSWCCWAFVLNRKERQTIKIIRLKESWKLCKVNKFRPQGKVIESVWWWSFREAYRINPPPALL